MWAKQKGFTIVELLIVIVVIGILAAITIVAFNGVQNRARIAAVQSSASAAAKKALAYAPLNNDSYPDESSFQTAFSLPTPSAQFVYDYFVTDDRKNFCLSSANTATTPATAYASTATSGSTVLGRCVKSLSKNVWATNATTSEWAGRYSTNVTWETNKNDGPVGVTSYMRQTVPTAVTGAGRGFDFNVNLDVTPATNSPTNWPVTANNPVSVSVYIRSSITIPNLFLNCRAYNPTTSAWVSNATQSANVNNPANTWTNISVTYTSTAAGYLACTARFSDSVTWPQNATMDATGILVVNGSSQYEVSSASFNNWLWTGAAATTPSFGPAQPDN